MTAGRGRVLAMLGIALVVACTAAGQACAGATSTAFRNPIAPVYATDDGATMDSPDPWLQYWHGHYYMTSSTTGVAIRKAKTIGELASATPTRVWEPSETDRPTCCWAPEFHRLDGPDGTRWYVYYASGGANVTTDLRVRVLESASDDPLGPYTFKGTLDQKRYGIDATVYRAPDRRLYIIYSGEPEAGGFQRLYIQAMSNPWTVQGDRVQISQPELYWEIVGIPTNEGPETLTHDGKLNVVYSASACWTDEYKLGRLTVDERADLLDPATWAHAKAPNPVFQASVENSVYGPGHNGFFTSPDGKQSWIVYHGHSKPGAFATGGACFGSRTARAQRFGWNRDGTPNFGTPVSVAHEMAAPAGDPTLEVQTEDTTVTDSSGDPHSVVGPDYALVGERGTSLQADAAGDFVTYAVTVPRSGTYEVATRVKRGPDAPRFAVATLARPGSPPRDIGTPQDLYNRQPGYRELGFGRAFLGSGKHFFRFAVTGKNESSSGYTLALDEILLTPVAASASPIPVARPKTRLALSLRCKHGSVRARVAGRDRGRVRSVRFYAAGRPAALRRRAPFAVTLAGRRFDGARRWRVRAVARVRKAPRVTLRRTIARCPRG